MHFCELQYAQHFDAEHNTCIHTHPQTHTYAHTYISSYNLSGVAGGSRGAILGREHRRKYLCLVAIGVNTAVGEAGCPRALTFQI